MTDYFAVLEQPRLPWLDPTVLKEAYHRQTLENHPDTAVDQAADFAELNEAYQVLQDPKRRLHHLLSLENRLPSPNESVPADLQELFLKIGETNQRATPLLDRARNASNPLAKSLLKSELLAAQKEVDALRERVRQLIGADDERLRRLSAGQLDEISSLYQRFAYLSRWSAQLDELAFQLS